MKVILAGSYHQALGYAWRQGWDKHANNGTWVYARDETSLLGLEIESEDDIIVVGTFRQRRDSSRLMQMTLARIRPRTEAEQGDQ